MSARFAEMSVARRAKVSSRVQRRARAAEAASSLHAAMGLLPAVNVEQMSVADLFCFQSLLLVSLENVSDEIRERFEARFGCFSFGCMVDCVILVGGVVKWMARGGWKASGESGMWKGGDDRGQREAVFRIVIPGTFRCNSAVSGDSKWTVCVSSCGDRSWFGVFFVVARGYLRCS